jgi:hypothetical protein
VDFENVDIVGKITDVEVIANGIGKREIKIKHLFLE